MSVVRDQFVVFTSEDVKSIIADVEGAAAAITGTAEVTLNFGVLAALVSAANRRKKFALWQVEVMRKTGTSGTNYQPQVYVTTAAATTAYATKYLGASTAPGTRFSVNAIDMLLYTNSSGNLFFKVNGDVADTFDYALWFKAVE